MKKRVISVFFNASVVLAGFKSPKGGSGKILSWAKQRKVKGVISEIILDEILRNSLKIGFDKLVLEKKIKEIFQIEVAPKPEIVKKYNSIVIYFGDAHVLASAEQAKTEYLVSLDQKHILILKDKIKVFKIVTPGELIQASSSSSIT